MTRPRAADDFATIRARLGDLCREREQAGAAGNDLLSDFPVGRRRTDSWTPGGISATRTGPPIRLITRLARSRQWLWGRR